MSIVRNQGGNEKVTIDGEKVREKLNLKTANGLNNLMFLNTIELTSPIMERILGNEKKLGALISDTSGSYTYYWIYLYNEETEMWEKQGDLQSTLGRAYLFMDSDNFYICFTDSSKNMVKFNCDTKKFTTMRYSGTFLLNLNGTLYTSKDNTYLYKDVGGNLTQITKLPTEFYTGNLKIFPFGNKAFFITTNTSKTFVYKLENDVFTQIVINKPDSTYENREIESVYLKDRYIIIPWYKQYTLDKAYTKDDVVSYIQKLDENGIITNVGLAPLRYQNSKITNYKNKIFLVGRTEILTPSLFSNVDFFSTLEDGYVKI